MAVLPIVEVGHPALREPARPVSEDELASPEFQSFIDDLIDTMRAAGGAGLAANQVADLRRVAVVEVRAGNPRYPYKPEIPLTVIVNPELEPASDRTMMINEGCLSVPNMRGEVPRHEQVRVRFTGRDGTAHEELRSGLTAGTFQHEVDHLDGIMFLDRVSDPRTFMTWAEFDARHREAFVARAQEIVRRTGS